MRVFTTIQDAKNYLVALRAEGKTTSFRPCRIGLVPTMGALHRGHVALLERAKRENDKVVASIFVNPLQFNDKKDLDAYPRTLESDIEVLKTAGCDMLFAPSVEEMYPDRSNSPSPIPLFFDSLEETEKRRMAETEMIGEIKLGHLDKVMEGAHRPGHFQGVCVVVEKLFDIIEPSKAYFGEKDFQQLAIIKYMVKLLNIPVQIISCPTVREADGLAMSSRNALLTSDERKNAAHIYKTMQESRKKWKIGRLEDWKDTKGSIPPSFYPSIVALKKWVAVQINSNPFLKLEYFEIVNAETLMPVHSLDEAKLLRACIAVKVGAVRLIDNIAF